MRLYEAWSAKRSAMLRANFDDVGATIAVSLQWNFYESISLDAGAGEEIGRQASANLCWARRQAPSGSTGLD